MQTLDSNCVLRFLPQHDDDVGCLSLNCIKGDIMKYEICLISSHSKAFVEGYPTKSSLFTKTFT